MHIPDICVLYVGFWLYLIGTVHIEQVKYVVIIPVS